jgi:hypothetical protein
MEFVKIAAVNAVGGVFLKLFEQVAECGGRDVGRRPFPGIFCGHRVEPP